MHKINKTLRPGSATAYPNSTSIHTYNFIYIYYIPQLILKQVYSNNCYKQAFRVTIKTYSEKTNQWSTVDVYVIFFFINTHLSTNVDDVLLINNDRYLEIFSNENNMCFLTMTSDIGITMVTLHFELIVSYSNSVICDTPKNRLHIFIFKLLYRYKWYKLNYSFKSVWS